MGLDGLIAGRRARHEDQAEDGLGDDVQDTVDEHLESYGEVAEALSKDPDDRVAEPGDDSDTGDLGVDGTGLAALGLGRLGPGLAQREDDVQEPAHAEEPPHPLDIAHSERAESAARDHEDVREAQGHDIPAADTGDDAEVDEEEGSGDEPVQVARHEKLPAIRSNDPAATRRHGEVRDGSDTRDKGGREEHAASSLALGGVDADEQRDAREHDEDELEQSLAKG